MSTTTAPSDARVSGSLTTNDLSVAFKLKDGSSLPAVRGVTLSIQSGKVVGLVGESGSGKSALSLAIMKLHGENTVIRGSVQLGDRNLLPLSEGEWNHIRGNHISMIFQDPMTALDPIKRIGHQLSSALGRHRRLNTSEKKTAAIALLERVGVPEPERRVNQFPHQLSGGLRQRVVIALGIASNPLFLFADEPTTALDAGVKMQILDLLRGLVAHSGMGLILISHDLPMMATIADEIVVMYAGQVVEIGPVRDVIERPLHPYTRGLLSSLPTAETPRKSRLQAIEGTVPDLRDLAPGCSFQARCPRAQAKCREAPPLEGGVGGRSWRCFFPITDANP